MFNPIEETIIWKLNIWDILEVMNKFFQNSVGRIENFHSFAMIASEIKALTLFVMNPLMFIFFFGLLMKMVEQFYNKNNLQCK